MLLRVGLENLWSFRDRTELSFVGTALTDEPDYRIPHPAAPNGVLPVLAVYGGNASGKSNLLQAIIGLFREVRDSFKRDVGAEIPRTPFLLRRAPRELPSRLDVDFTVDDDRLHYGFVFDDARVIEEWLYLWKAETRRQTLLFHRQGEDKRDWVFGAALGGTFRRIAVGTRREVLIFSRLASEDHPRLKVWHEAFVKALSAQRIELTSATDLLHPNAPVLAPENRELVRALLRSADAGIEDVRVQDPDGSRSYILRRLERLGVEDSQLEDVAAVFKETPELHIIELGHQAEEGIVYLSPDQESIGTQSLLRLLNPILHALARGKLVMLDEMGGGLHPRLVSELVGLFTDPASNPRGAQLVFTTHDSQIMEHLRRDEILLVDKGRDGASTLRALSDLKLRKRDDWRRAYELGLAGGVPFPRKMSEVLARRESRS